ncbi:hypothetical protein TSH7_28505 [Azospirillum sp. TSH7]|nr:hypothetical protein TSH20_33370 [Azospirillum sp. TSH20]PWC56312.1 hypothetical protein TSH7_28505 [Azospirillum sp. TSH7]
MDRGGAIVAQQGADGGADVLPALERQAVGRRMDGGDQRAQRIKAGGDGGEVASDDAAEAAQGGGMVPSALRRQGGVGQDARQQVGQRSHIKHRRQAGRNLGSGGGGHPWPREDRSGQEVRIGKT